MMIMPMRALRKSEFWLHISLVADEPIITESPKKNNQHNEGDALYLTCKADGYPPPNITWTHLAGNRIVGHGERLQIYSARKEDKGTYTCAASNGFGQDARAYFTISVYCKYTIVDMVEWQKRDLYRVCIMWYFK